MLNNERSETEYISNYEDRNSINYLGIRIFILRKWDSLTSIDLSKILFTKIATKWQIKDAIICLV